MWVLLVFAVNTQIAFSVPGYSSEQTCSAKGAEVVRLGDAKNLPSRARLRIQEFRCGRFRRGQVFSRLPG